MNASYGKNNYGGDDDNDGEDQINKGDSFKFLLNKRYHATPTNYFKQNNACLHFCPRITYP